LAFWCYILRCADGKFYTGHTDNLEVRFGQHQTGGYCAFTSQRRPVTLAWAQDFPTRLEALEAEMKIKPWSRAKKEALIDGDWKRVSFFAIPPKERGTRGDNPSTSLGTNGVGVGTTKTPFVSSAVEGPVQEGNQS
jgi:putative endonuclease